MPKLRLVVLIAVAVLARAASAQPSAAPQATGSPQCSTSWYLEPSVLLAIGSYSPASASVERPSNAGAVTNRIAGGVELRFCDAADVPTTRAHLGATVYATSLGWIDHDDVKAGVGVELEVTRPVATRVWFGGRLGLETAEASMGLFTLGGRVHIDQRFWIGVDVFHRQPASGTTWPSCADSAVERCSTTTTGVMAGLGVEGKAGVITAAVESGIVVTAFTLLVLAFAGGG